MDLGLIGKTALVLGAGGGLGSAIARSLAREGANVVLADVAKDNVDKAAAEIAGGGAKSLSLAWDIADHAVIEPRMAEK